MLPNVHIADVAKSSRLPLLINVADTGLALGQLFLQKNYKPDLLSFLVSRGYTQDFERFVRRHNFQLLAANHSAPAPCAIGNRNDLGFREPTIAMQTASISNGVETDPRRAVDIALQGNG